MSWIENARKVYEKFRYGLVLQVIHDRLLKYGIEITPFYLMRERVKERYDIQDREQFKEFSFEFFGPEEMKIIGAIPWVSESEETLVRKLGEGHLCYGAKYKGEIASFMFYDFEKCSAPIACA